jgi:hypothetical protein
MDEKDPDIDPTRPLTPGEIADDIEADLTGEDEVEEDLGATTPDD